MLLVAAKWLDGTLQDLDKHRDQIFSVQDQVWVWGLNGSSTIQIENREPDQGSVKI